MANRDVSLNSDQNNESSKRPARESKTKLLQNPTWGSKKPKGNFKSAGQSAEKSTRPHSADLEVVGTPNRSKKKGIGCRSEGKGTQKAKRKRVLSDSESAKSGDEEQAVQGDGKLLPVEQVKVPKKRKMASTGAPTSQSSANFDAPDIDIDGTESSSTEDEPLLPKTPARVKSNKSCISEQKEGANDFNDDGEAAGHDSLGDEDDERPEERDFGERMTDTQVSHERINWTAGPTLKAHAGENNDGEELSGVNIPSSQDTPTAMRPDRPRTRKAPPSDNDSQSDSPSDPPRPRKGGARKEKKKQARRLFPLLTACIFTLTIHLHPHPITQKLAQELPTVTKKPPRGQSAASIVPSDSEGDCNWLQRTDITDALTPSSSNKWTVNLKPMGPELHAIMKLSFTLCQMHFVFRDLNDPPLTSSEQVPRIVTGFDNAGANDFALQALVKAATDKGYDGENDIVDRLLYGSPNLYVDPLVGYVSISYWYLNMIPH
ncbi:hypothetical protein DICSQDRAFT_173997 [Dichomitus squalens LYAD-421 SS1]|uniref:Uncharacterized protein n=1 Tax=Dichomitus squalens (strain LYAD-421) TaxID=732165 RepID=R7SNX4_DICSQ|nr:uncharacterized protein DICSQDRAFT_173997 [Dichomitus squalens LYAD-421 SS1]EJF57440.1 hypothetical protein DICSQDRAFT_173997 [Dichomitus squalens LYAD-421 SS1]